ncbi:MAG: hypothetical protein MUD12_12605 [Spirochaetes bacterium]|jgi:hypothetical protein|nr:hypothetical protein [Spirochaetota bacterium]
MKKTALLVFLTAIISAAAYSDSLVENKGQWWKIRLQKLTEEKKSLSAVKPAFAPEVLAAVDFEIAETEAIIPIYEAYKTDRGSLTDETREFSENETASITDGIFVPMFNLYYLDSVLSDINGAAGVEKAKKTAVEKIASMLSSRFGREWAGLSATIAAEDITQNEWKNMGAELFISAAADGSSAAMKINRGIVLSAVRGKACSRTNMKDLASLAEKTAAEHLKNRDLASDIPSGAGKIEESGTWMSVEARLKKDMDNYGKIMGMLDGPDRSSPRWVRYYSSRLNELESAVFNGRHGSYLYDGGPGETYDPSKNKAASVMTIPESPDFDTALSEIDRTRKAIIHSTNGSEEAGFFKEAETKFSNIISRHTGAAKDAFDSEERKTLESGGTDRAANAGQFAESKRTFEKRTGLLGNYVKKNMEFIRWLSSARKTDPEGVKALYSARTARADSCVKFIAGLFKSASSAVSPGLQAVKKMETALRKTDSFFRLMAAGAEIDKSLPKQLGPRRVREMREMKAALLNGLKIARMDMRRHLSELESRYGSLAKSSKESYSSLREKIIQNEIDALYKIASNYSRVYGSLNYAEDALMLYFDRFNSLKHAAETGAASADLDNAVKKGSVLQAIGGFDRNRIQRERQAKEFLARETKASHARLVSAAAGCRKGPAHPKDLPTKEEFDSLTAPLKRTFVVRIASWRMCESNLEEIDRKAAKLLADTVHRKAWAGDRNGTRDRTSPGGMVIRLSDPAVTFELPAGLTEGTVTDLDRESGVVKSFASRDRESVVSLILVKTAKPDPKLAMESWMKKKGVKAVKERWGKNDGREYFWTISRDGDKNILETYSFPGSGWAIIVAGKTTREKYSLFREKLDAIAGSLKN